MLETGIQSLGREDPLEKEMATHSSILAWKILWTEEPGRLQFMGSQRVGHNWATLLLLGQGLRNIGGTEEVSGGLIIKDSLSLLIWAFILKAMKSIETC